jgi:hypothetical protein
MRDPVIATDGFTYERSAIAAWLARSATSPMTNLPLPDDFWRLIPNRTVKAQIREWQEVLEKEEQGPNIYEVDGSLCRIVKKVAGFAESVDGLLFGTPF